MKKLGVRKSQFKTVTINGELRTMKIPSQESIKALRAYKHFKVINKETKELVEKLYK